MLLILKENVLPYPNFDSAIIFSLSSLLIILSKLLLITKPNPTPIGLNKLVLLLGFCPDSLNNYL